MFVTVNMSSLSSLSMCAVRVHNGVVSDDV